MTDDARRIAEARIEELTSELLRMIEAEPVPERIHTLARELQNALDGARDNDVRLAAAQAQQS